MSPERTVEALKAIDKRCGFAKHESFITKYNPAGECRLIVDSYVDNEASESGSTLHAVPSHFFDIWAEKCLTRKSADISESGLENSYNNFCYLGGIDDEVRSIFEIGVANMGTVGKERFALYITYRGAGFVDFSWIREAFNLYQSLFRTEHSEYISDNSIPLEVTTYDSLLSVDDILSGLFPKGNFQFMLEGKENIAFHPKGEENLDRSNNIGKLYLLKSFKKIT